MAFDRRAGGHRFDDRGDHCQTCGMSRKTWDDTRKPCTGRGQLSIDDDEAPPDKR